MTKPKLYWTKISPPARAVVQTAKLLNLELDLVEINLTTGDHMKPEFLKINPQHTIPLLVDDGAVVYDSHAISAYLVGKYGKEDDSLYPKDLVKRAQVDARLHFNSLFLFGRVRPLIEPVFHGQTSLNADQVKYAELAYPILEAFLAESKYLCGDQLTIADVCCEATLCSQYLLLPIDAEKYPKLAAWRHLLSVELPDYESILAEGGRLLQQFLQSKLTPS